jgi:hypothetical protein
MILIGHTYAGALRDRFKSAVAGQEPLFPERRGRLRLTSGAAHADARKIHILIAAVFH